MGERPNSSCQYVSSLRDEPVRVSPVASSGERRVSRNPRTRAVTTALWCLLGGLFLFLAPTQIWLGTPVWQGGTSAFLEAIGLGVAYWIGAGLLPLVEHGEGRRPLATVANGALPLAAFYLTLMVLGVPYSRGVLFVGSALFGLLLVAPTILARRLATTSAALAGVLAVVTILGLTGGPPAERAAPTNAGDRKGPLDTLVTNRGVLAARHLPSVGDTAWGGGLARVGDDVLLVTGSGEFFRIRPADDPLVVEPVALRAPLNRDDFVAATDTTVGRDLFRAAGLLVQPAGDSLRILVSHHHWNVDERCFALRLSETRVPAADLLGDGPGGRDPSGTWRTVYETKPCLGLKSLGEPFAGQQAGGRIAALGDTALLLTVGDHQFDGVNSENALPQERNNDYGKTLLIPRNGPARVYTLGHRNPQGLVVTSAGEIWITEHGPKGGDELNRLIDGANYGWPLRTFGTQYDEFTWPLADTGAPPGAFVDPWFAWVPSIGISNLIEIETDAIPGWKGDLLVAALDARSLVRLHRDEGRIVYSEPIEIGSRVRDLVETADGRLVLWFDGDGVSVYSPIDPE